MSDKQVRNWIANKSLPNDIITIERVLFGRDQEQSKVWRMELRDALKRTRAGGAPTAPASGEVAPVIRIQAEGAGLQHPMLVPEHFLGRDDALAAIEAALNRYEGGRREFRLCEGFQTPAVTNIPTRTAAGV